MPTVSAPKPITPPESTPARQSVDKIPVPDSHRLKDSSYLHRHQSLRFPEVRSREQPDFGTDAARIRESLSSSTTDEAKILEVVREKTPPDIAKIATLYRNRYGRDMIQDLRENLRGPLQPQISDNMLKIGEAIYGYEAAQLAAYFAGYRPTKNGVREDPLRGLDKNVAQSLLAEVLKEHFKGNPQLEGKTGRAYEEFFGKNLSPSEAAKEYNKLLLP